MATARQPAADRWAPDPDFAGRPVHVIEYDRTSLDDDDVTAQSIGLMHRLATRDASTAPIAAAVRDSLAQLGDHASPKEIADAIYQWVQRTVTYQHETEMRTPFADLAAFAYDQTLITPAALVAMPRPAGDCVDYSMLVAALCRACGITTAYRTIAADPESEAYSHVYVIAELEPGQFYPLDASNGPAPGAEFALPAGKKSRTWPNPADLENPMRKDLSYSRRHARLGDVAEGTEPDSGSAGLSPASDSGGGTDWTKIATVVINDAAGIAAPIIRQNNIQAPYYIAGANGAQILYDPSTGKTANAGAASQRTPAVVSQNLLIGGLAAIGVFLAVSMSNKR